MNYQAVLQHTYSVTENFRKQNAEAVLILKNVSREPLRKLQYLKFAKFCAEMEAVPLKNLKKQTRIHTLFYETPDDAELKRAGEAVKNTSRTLGEFMRTVAIAL